MRKAKSSIDFTFFALSIMALHLLYYRYVGVDNQRMFFVSLYGWVWVVCLNGLMLAKTNIKKALWGIQVALSFNFAAMELWGVPTGWRKGEWMATLVSGLHGVLVLLHCLLYKKYWYQVFLLSINEYFYKIKSCITKHHKYK